MEWDWALQSIHNVNTAHSSVPEEKKKFWKQMVPWLSRTRGRSCPRPCLMTLSCIEWGKIIESVKTLRGKRIIWIKFWAPSRTDVFCASLWVKSPTSSAQAKETNICGLDPEFGMDSGDGGISTMDSGPERKDTENGAKNCPVKWYQYSPNVRYFWGQWRQCATKWAISMERKGNKAGFKFKCLY